MFMENKFKALAVAASLAFSLSGTAAFATTIGSCDANFDGPPPTTISVDNYVVPTSDCFSFFGLPDGAGAKLTALNTLTINGETGGWSSLGKFEPNGSNANFSVSGGTASGLWSLTNAAWESFGEFLMIFKAGQEQNTEPSEFVGYILAGQRGTWQSPLLNANNANPRGLSNVELFARGDAPPPPPPPSYIPLPAAGWLLLTALGGLGVAGLRRRRKDA